MTNRPQAGPIIASVGDVWEKYLRYGVRRAYPANRTLLYPGEQSDLVYYIQSGEVLISSYASPESLSRLFILRGRSLLGLIGMFTPSVPMVSWLTLKPCVCYLFTKKDIYEKLPRELLLNMLEQMGAMSSSMSRMFAHGNTKRLDARLARLLVHLTDACPRADAQPPGGLAVAPSVTQEMASELLGMHPVTMNRLIASLRAEGLLGRFTKKRLEILDFNRLVAYADGTVK
jgi:CRP-like cAMP-binding protein